MRIWIFDLSSWMTWFSVAIGLSVTLIVLWISGVIAARRRTLAVNFGEIPWDQLLELLKEGQSPGGALPDAWNNLPPDKLLQVLLQQIPKRSPSDIPTTAATVEDDDAGYLNFGRQRRSSRRRWLNPTEVSLTTAFNETPLKGLVINRSDGGLAVLTDTEHAIGSLLFAKAIEMPKNIQAVTIAVRHVRPVGRLWIIGCQYVGEVPWNIKVWFG